MAKNTIFRIPSNDDLKVKLKTASCKECGSPGYTMDVVGKTSAELVHMTTTKCKTCGSPGYKIEAVKPAPVQNISPGYSAPTPVVTPPAKIYKGLYGPTATSPYKIEEIYYQGEEAIPDCDCGICSYIHEKAKNRKEKGLVN